MCHVQVLAKILRLTGTSVTKEDSLCSPHCKVSSRIYHKGTFSFWKHLWSHDDIFAGVSSSCESARSANAQIQVFYFLFHTLSTSFLCFCRGFHLHTVFFVTSLIPSISNNERKLLDLRPLNSTQRPFWGSVHLTRWVFTIAGGQFFTTVLIFRHFEKELMMLKRWSGRNSVGLVRTSMPSSLKSLKAVSQNKTGIRSHFVFFRNKNEYYLSRTVKWKTFWTVFLVFC